MRRLLGALLGGWALLIIAAPAAVAAGEPVLSTGNATAITSTSATLNGTVNPEGQATTYYFEYGTTTSYGSQTAASDAGSGTANVKVSAPSASLAPATTYHYRLVATNGAGTTLGSDVSFKTPRTPTPVVSTGHVKDVTQTSATLTGTVNPEGQASGYYFQYGTTPAYGGQTPMFSAGAGTKSVTLSAAIGPLAPDTTYHYRLVASNDAGTTYGHDVSFKTGRPPAGITLAASPSVITFGQATSIGGRVLAPRPPQLTVTLQSASSPAGPWGDDATTTATASGAYSFGPAGPASNTYYRALADGAMSAPVRVVVRFRVGLLVSRAHPPAGTLVRFHGRVAPRHPWHCVFIQRLGPHGHWHTIRRTRLRSVNPAFSFYSVRVSVERSGRYRVMVGPDRTHAPGRSPTVRIQVR